MKNFFTVIFFLVTIYSSAQTYTMLSPATYTTCSGDFYDAGGSSQDYPQNQNVTVTFFPTDTTNDKLSVIFNLINIEQGDTLFVYNGNSTSASLLASLTGILTGTISSSFSNGSLTFKFTSDGTNSIISSQGGWTASFACNYTPNPLTMIAPGTYATCAGNFYDAGGNSQDYPQNQNVTVTLFPVNTSTNKLSSNFSSVQIEPGDTLFAYNGNNTSAPLLAALTGNTTGTIISTACDGSLTFKFTSDATNSIITSTGGWVATISCNTVTPFSVTYTQTNINCSGANNGSINVSVSGGFTPYSYLWSNAATTKDINGLSAGTYTLTVTDANSCTKTISVNITQPTVLTTFISSQSNVTCNGGNNGSATVGVIGGTLQYSYLWSSGATTATISNKTAGTYTVTVTDANGCTTSSSVTITEPTTPLSSSIVSSDSTSCNGGNDGLATVNATGGTTPYSFNWNTTPVQTTTTANNLPAGNYTVVVTDNNNCTSSSTVTISQPPAIVMNLAVIDSISCNGDSNGSAVCSASNGISPYSFQWDNSQTTDTIFNLSAGIYSVTVTDNNGCNISGSINISDPLLITSFNNFSLCSGDSVLLGGNYQTSAGIYYDTLSSINGCDSIIASTLSIYPIPPSPVSSDTTVCDGFVVPDLTASGTNVQWYTDSLLNNLVAIGNVFVTGQTDVGVNNYYATETQNGCESPATTITLTIFANPAIPLISQNGTDLICSENSMEYEWLLNGNPVSNCVTQTCICSQNGSYTVVITDINSCSSSSAPFNATGCNVGIESAAVSENNFTIIPNPNNGKFTIKISNDGKIPCKINIYNILIEKIYSFSGISLSNLEIDISKQPRGIYYVQIETRVGIKSGKVVVE